MNFDSLKTKDETDLKDYKSANEFWLEIFKHLEGKWVEIDSLKSLAGDIGMSAIRSAANIRNYGSRIDRSRTHIRFFKKETNTN